MAKRACLVTPPIWSDLFYSGYADLDDPVQDRHRKHKSRLLKLPRRKPGRHAR